MSADPDAAKPMGSAELDALREHLSSYPPGSWLKVGRDDFVALLADRDRQEHRAREAELNVDFLARLIGSAICRMSCVASGEAAIEHDPAIADHALTQATEDLRARTENATARVERLTDEWRVETCRLRAEVARLRARVRVEAADVERAGVTWAQVVAWLAAKGWTTPKVDAYGWVVSCNSLSLDRHDLARRRDSESERVAQAVCYLAGDVFAVPSTRILDEMAAMPTVEGPE